MRFIDEAKISISAGHGGPGSVSFRREKFIPLGGPDGGDGGDGGDVYVETDEQLSTLQDFKFKRIYKAPNGMHGSGVNKAGKDGIDIVIRVPVGTLIKDQTTNEILFDLNTPNLKIKICEGGRGGKGNAHFVSSTFQAPKFAQPGLPGDAKEVTLELKLLADVALIGYPNAGKSTLISTLSHAKPKIADYPFTTLTPNLGVVLGPDYKTLVVADIPGLIEGAHAGAGLGTKFLKHIERTKILVHLLEIPIKEDPENYLDVLKKNYQAIRKELKLFNSELADKPEFVVISKADLIYEFESSEELKKLAKDFRTFLKKSKKESLDAKEPLVISCANQFNIAELTNHLFELLQIVRDNEAKEAAKPAVAKLFKKLRKDGKKNESSVWRDF